MKNFRALLLGALCVAVAGARGAEPTVEAEDLPRVPPTEPGEALAGFEIKEGFRLELAAAEPLVADPIAICFDENSRMFVVEMRDYSERRDDRLGRIRMLEDRDEDGQMDRSTVFAEGLAWPTALFWYDGGLFVVSTPDIYYFRDEDNDGKADTKQIVFTGFGTQVSRLNVQALPNNLHWTLDNRIHGATSFNGGLVECPEHPERGKLSLRGQDFSFDPKTLEMRAESGGGQHGLTFDNYGRKFICSNSSHIRQVMYEARYLKEGMGYPLPGPALDIPVDGAAAEVYRLSPDEPWRVMRTKWRVEGLVSGPIEGGGRASGYFTSASGLVIYRGDALGKEFVGDEFVADVGSNLVHRKKLHGDGVAFRAERPADEEKVEFLASRDNWFRPVQLANGPDGALYVLDMYRETIEHPWSLPPNIKKHLDLNSGNTRGRIYRVVPEDFRRKDWPKPGQLGSGELVRLLEHENGWHRDTASRLLYERGDRSVTPLVRKLASESRNSLGRLHALGVLAGLESLKPEDLVRALEDEDAGVRENAVRWSERFLTGASIPEGLWAALTSRVGDESARVRAQLAWTIGLGAHPMKWELLSELLRGAEDPWLRHAVLANASGNPIQVWGRLHREDRFSQAGRDLLELAGRRNDPDDLRELEMRLRNASGEDRIHVVAGLVRGAKAAGRRGQVEELPMGEEALKGAAQVLGSARGGAELQRDAIELLGADAASSELLLEQLSPKTPAEVQLAAIEALASGGNRKVAEALASRFIAFTPGIRERAIEILLQRSGTTRALLERIATGALPGSTIPIHHRERIRTSNDAELKRLANEILGEGISLPVEQLMARYGSALSTSGEREKGKVIYAERCASCHRFQGEGFAVGPDLETIQQAGRESALVNIIDPNREVAPRYVSYEIETTDGESYTGVISQETPASVTLRQAGGFEMDIPRATIAKMQGSGKSLMPERLEEGLSAGEMADLLEYIMR